MNSAPASLLLRNQSIFSPFVAFLIVGLALLSVATSSAPCQRRSSTPVLHADASGVATAAADLNPLDPAEPDPVQTRPVQTDAMLELPDSPGATLSSSSSYAEQLSPQVFKRQFGLSGKSDAELARQPASATAKFIYPGQTAPKLTARDKVAIGLIHGVSAYSILGWFVSSGISHGNDSSPNYGVDKGAFGERLGASAIRGYSAEILKDSVLSPILHQDPRYYKMGPGHSLRVRAGYAVSRILVTRNDNGRLAPNYTVVGGNLLGAALTNAYYPEVNRSLGQTAQTFGASMYGGSLSYLASEFLSEALEKIHLRESH